MSDAAFECIKGIADRLVSAKDVQVRVVGHTDRVGSEAANRDLSQRRAETVGRFFVERGVPATAVRAEGRGESDPVTVGCSDSLPRSTLIECLRPDRRVELFVRGIEAK